MHRHPESRVFGSGCQSIHSNAFDLTLCGRLLSREIAFAGFSCTFHSHRPSIERKAPSSPRSTGSCLVTQLSGAIGPKMCGKAMGAAWPSLAAPASIFTGDVSTAVSMARQRKVSCDGHEARRQSTEARLGGSGAGAHLDLSVDVAERRVLEVEHAEQQRLEGRWRLIGGVRLQGCTAGPERPDSAVLPKGPRSAPAPRAAGGHAASSAAASSALVRLTEQRGAASCVAWMNPSLPYLGGKYSPAACAASHADCWTT